MRQIRPVSTIPRRAFSTSASSLANSAPPRPSRPQTRFPTLHNPVRSASNPKIQLPAGELVYNPAPSAPSPYKTPSVFLPKGVKRLTAESDPRNKEYPIEFMPALREPKEKKYNLTEDDLIEIHKLRTSDPRKWTRKRLAAKFDCSEFMIGVASKPSPSYTKKMSETLDKIKESWSPRTSRARNDRARRRKLWIADAM